MDSLLARAARDARVVREERAQAAEPGSVDVGIVRRRTAVARKPRSAATAASTAPSFASLLDPSPRQIKGKAWWR